jgi:nucleotide-binding universal stress UspA family protein
VNYKLNVKRILCPVDFSTHSQSANIYASLLAEACGAEILYLYADWPPNDDSPVATHRQDLADRLENEVRPAVRGLNHRYEIRDGEPAREILHLAEEANVDLIVLGTHGRTGAMRLLYGSVCEKVLRGAHCPVMTVKPSQKSGIASSDDDHSAVPAE